MLLFIFSVYHCFCGWMNDTRLCIRVIPVSRKELSHFLDWITLSQWSFLIIFSERNGPLFSYLCQVGISILKSHTRILRHQRELKKPLYCVRRQGSLDMVCTNVSPLFFSCSRGDVILGNKTCVWCKSRFGFVGD